MSAFGFAIPALLLVVPCAIAFLLYIYRKRGHANAVTVSTLLLLRNLKGQVQVRKKVFPPLRFFFELLLLLGLIFAAAGLYKLQGDSSVVVLFDNSFSMSAGTKLIDAKKIARQCFINKSVNLFVTSPTLKSVGSGADASYALEKIEAQYAVDNLDAAVGELSKKYHNIIVITDKTARQTSNIDVKTVSTRGKNVSIVGISKNAASIEVLVHSFAHDRENVRIDGYYWREEGLEFVKRKFDSKEESIAPGVTKTIEFKIPSAAQAFMAEVSYTQGFDNLVEDNKAWLALDDSSSNIVVVSELSKLGLEKIPNLNFKFVTPSSYDANLDLIKKAKFIIFHRVAPAGVPERPSLIIKPNSSNSFFELAGAATKANVTSYNEAHPLMRYLNPHILDSLEIQPIKSLTLDTVLSSDAGAAILAGDVSNRKIVISGIELFPYEGKSSPFMTVLTLNIFDYLSGNVLDSYASVYSSLSDAKYLDGVLAGGAINGEIAAPGLIKQADTLIAANYFSEQESDIFRNEGVTIPERPLEKNSFDEEKLPLAQELLLFVLLFLAADTCFFLYKRVHP